MKHFHHYAKLEIFFLISLIKKKKKASSLQFYAGFVWFLTFFIHNYLTWSKLWKKVWFLNIKMLYTKNNFTLALWQNDTVHKSISITVSLLPQQTDIYSGWIHWPLSSGRYGRTLLQLASSNHSSSNTWLLFLNITTQTFFTQLSFFQKNPLH